MVRSSIYEFDYAGIERDRIEMERRESMNDVEVEDWLMTSVLSGGCELTNEQTESKMSEGYHHFGGSNYGYDIHTKSRKPAMPEVEEPRKESAEGVRDVRRVLDEIKVYADKLTTDVKIPRATVKDWIKRLEAVAE